MNLTECRDRFWDICIIRAGHGDVYQKDVEQEFRIRRSTATVMLQSLEQKGYLVRVASTEDARLKRILLTEKAIRAS